MATICFAGSGFTHVVALLKGFGGKEILYTINNWTTSDSGAVESSRWHG
jgi:hypothetical protein